MYCGVDRMWGSGLLSCLSVLVSPHRGVLQPRVHLQLFYAIRWIKCLALGCVYELEKELHNMPSSSNTVKLLEISSANYIHFHFLHIGTQPDNYISVKQHLRPVCLARSVFRCSRLVT